MTLTKSIENCTVQSIYALRNWDGNTPLRFSYFVDPFRVHMAKNPGNFLGISILRVKED